MLDKIKSLMDTKFFNPDENPDLSVAQTYQKSHLPTLWLLGNTGAGKSSLVKALTNGTNIDIGNGFSPCTMTASLYRYPPTQPILQFLDTRGLAEAHYDPSEDIAQCGEKGHLLVVVAKTEEVEQSAVISALKKIRKNGAIQHAIVVHTAVQQCNDTEAQRLITHKQNAFETAWGKPLPQCAVDFETASGEVFQLDELIERLSSLLPIVELMVEKKTHATREEADFDRLENEILWYAGTASATDLLPAVGLVSVPTIQAKMLHSLANQYGIEWNKKVFSEFAGALGTTFGLQYGARLGIRELVKLIPYYGQTVGAVAAATMSFGATYGLGRVACYFFYQKRQKAPIDNEMMQSLYQQAFQKGKKAGESENA